jgi:hypothetical protein
MDDAFKEMVASDDSSKKSEERQIFKEPEILV